MKKIYVLLAISASVLFSDLNASASDTLREATYTLSSRNAEAQTGKYKKIDLALAFDLKTKTYTLELNSEREIYAYLEITDQDENIIYFKQTELKPGKNTVTFVAEDGHQTLFRLAFSEPYATKPAIFIIRENEIATAVQSEVIR